jgi:hypothetical protein
MLILFEPCKIPSCSLLYFRLHAHLTRADIVTLPKVSSSTSIHAYPTLGPGGVMMANLPVTQAQPSSDTARPQVHHQPRRGRGARNRGGRTARGSLTHGRAEGQATPEAPSTTESPSHTSGAGTGRNRGARGRRPDRNPRRGAIAQGRAAAFASRRDFGGHLTTAPGDADLSTAALNVEAPAFVPGQPLASTR